MPRREILCARGVQHAALRRDHDALAHRRECRGEDFLAVPVAVEIRGIEERNAAVEGGAQRGHRLGVVGRTVSDCALRRSAEPPGAETDLRDPQTAYATR